MTKSLREVIIMEAAMRPHRAKNVHDLMTGYRGTKHEEDEDGHNYDFGQDTKRRPSAWRIGKHLERMGWNASGRAENSGFGYYDQHWEHPEHGEGTFGFGDPRRDKGIFNDEPDDPIGGAVFFKHYTPEKQKKK
jgi:hypothetical protein